MKTRTEVIEALDRCTRNNAEDICDCLECPYRNNPNCMRDSVKDALHYLVMSDSKEEKIKAAITVLTAINEQ